MPTDKDFWSGKRVFVTGHTGFKGSWLCLWLHALGARVTGYALAPPTSPSMFEVARVGDLVDHHLGDVRQGEDLARVLGESRPEVVFHLAAQPLVRESYRTPAETYATNVLGTVHLLEAVRGTSGVRAVVNVTTDKCYENREWLWGYREHERLGGHDPYSSSKACSELATAAWRDSFFPPHRHAEHGVAVASARSGNVIGGGDWAEDRLVPDCLRALLCGTPVTIRNPTSIRPWQHVLEPLSGYLMLARQLVQAGPVFASAWNFGPPESEARTVEWMVRELLARWGDSAGFTVEQSPQPHEAHYLKLDCSKARCELGWNPRWSLEQALGSIVDWTRAWQDGADLREVCLAQISAYQDAEEGCR